MGDSNQKMQGHYLVIVLCQFENVLVNNTEAKVCCSLDQFILNCFGKITLLISATETCHMYLLLSWKSVKNFCCKNLQVENLKL